LLSINWTDNNQRVIKNIMILAHIWIENPVIMCIKGCWNNQNNMIIPHAWQNTNLLLSYFL
jgi:hypothetical protein